MFLKEKRDKRLKGRVSADSQKQRGISKKEDVVSPACALKSILITSLVNALEGRDVEITNIPGTYLNADMNKIIQMKLKGRMAELMVLMPSEVYQKLCHDVCKREPCSVCPNCQGPVQHAFSTKSSLATSLKRGFPMTHVWQTKW